MQYGYLNNPNVGSVISYMEPFHHAIHVDRNDSLIESYESNSGVVNFRVRLDARLWLNANLNQQHRVYAHHRMIVFDTKESAMLFKLVWG